MSSLVPKYSSWFQQLEYECKKAEEEQNLKVRVKVPTPRDMAAAMSSAARRIKREIKEVKANLPNSDTQATNKWKQENEEAQAECDKRAENSQYIVSDPEFESITNQIKAEIEASAVRKNEDNIDFNA